MKISVIGIGQSMRGDDAAGLEAVHRWQEQYPGTASRPGVRVELLEMPGLALLDSLAGVDAAILVDALQADAPAGSLLCVQVDDLASFGSDARSAHGWGVAETLLLGRSLNPILTECKILLVGIIAKQFTPGAGLSPEVQAGLTAAADRIESEIRSLLDQK